MSSLERRPFSLVIVMDSDLPLCERQYCPRSPHARYHVRSLVSGADFHDTVGVDLEGDLDLRNAARGRGDVGELELAEEMVVLGKSTLSFEDLDQNGGL